MQYRATAVQYRATAVQYRAVLCSTMQLPCNAKQGPSTTGDADVFVAEFRESIKPAIRQIVSLLSDGGPNVRIAGAYALSKLSEQGKV